MSRKRPKLDTQAMEPPNNVQAEFSLIGSLIIDRDAIVAVAPLVRPRDFYNTNNGRIFRAISRLYEERMPPDFTTLVDYLERSGELAQVGGVTHLTELINAVPTAVHAPYYAQIVRRCAMQRELIWVGTQISNLGFDDNATTDIKETIGKALSMVTDLDTASGGDDPRRLADLIEDEYEALDGEPVRPLTTGVIDLDAIIGGFLPKQLVILAARPSVGKSALMSQVAYHLAQQEQREVGIISLEMSGRELTQRLISIDSRLDMHQIRHGLLTRSLSDGQVAQISASLGRLHPATITIDDASGSSLSDVVVRAKSMFARYGLDILFIDYLQLMGETGRGSAENRVQEVSQFSRALKRLARELDIPVVALSQLSRASENRSDPRPRLSDLRESGSIEQDADMVVFIHRPDNYSGNAEPSVAELIVAKNRNGPANKLVKAYFHEATAEFRPLVHASNGRVA